jgi:predicted flavoprotein YhiN
MIDVFLEISAVDPDRTGSQIRSNERGRIVFNLKNFPLTISGSLPIEEGMVTAGGVTAKEIFPGTMESRLVPGLYFAGEAIDGAAASGGYNLQQAFSTGWLAGKSAAESI